MSNKLTRTVKSTTNFVSKHRVAIAVVATSSVWIYLGTKRAAEWNEFLKDHDLLEEFYALNEE
jgi:hypothetical protein